MEKGLEEAKHFGPESNQFQTLPPNVDHVPTLTTAPDVSITIIGIGLSDMDSHPVPPQENFKCSLQDRCSKPSTTFQWDSIQALTRPV